MITNKEDSLIILENSDYIEVDGCPACSSHNSKFCGYLSKQQNIRDFSVIIDLMASLGVVRCCDCDMVYKTHFTTLDTEVALQDIWNENQQSRWYSNYKSGLRKIVSLIEKTVSSYFVKAKIELADIGPGEGGILTILDDKFNKTGIEQNPNLSNAIMHNEEYKVYPINIENNLDRLPKQKFDVITAFDVFEHFSEPNKAIRNIHDLLNDNGLLFIETGNIDSYPARSKGYHQWWYTDIIEHKIFWSDKAIKNALQASGFSVVKIIYKSHKGQSLFNTTAWLKYLLFKISPELYMKLSRADSRTLKTPKYPWRDHLLVVARKQSLNM